MKEKIHYFRITFKMNYTRIIVFHSVEKIRVTLEKFLPDTSWPVHVEQWPIQRCECWKCWPIVQDGDTKEKPTNGIGSTVAGNLFSQTTLPCGKLANSPDFPATISSFVGTSADSSMNPPVFRKTTTLRQFETFYFSQRKLSIAVKEGVSKGLKQSSRNASWKIHTRSS